MAQDGTGDPATATPQRYFKAIRAALDGLDLFLRDESSGLDRHDLVAQVVVATIAKLERSFSAWQNRLAFSTSFRISQADSGFPAFQHVLELQDDRARAERRLAELASPETLRAEMADFILRHKAFPSALRNDLAERLYLESVKGGDFLAPLELPETIRLSVNPKTMRPYYLTHWSTFDGTANLPLIYMAAVEDSSARMVEILVKKDGTLNDRAGVNLPVAGLLNPDLARAFDSFAEKNSAYSLSPVTIAVNLDHDFEHLHPKQLRRIVLGPFWTAGITKNSGVVPEILGRIRKEENAWLLTWTVQEVFSKTEIPARKGLWSSQPAREEFHIETNDLEAAQMGVSAYQKHALVPHEAYQALYASGEARAIFAGYKVHIIANGTVVSDG